MSNNPINSRIIEVVSAASADESDLLTAQTVELVRDHDGSPEELAASLVADEI